MSVEYIDISIDFGVYLDRVMDIRIPQKITTKELLQTLVEAYSLQLEIDNPIVRVRGTNVLLTSFSRIADFSDIRSGSFLIVERI
ncbi:hypothetical protein [Gemella morbillorum]|jgi:YukD.|uniref:hypothetical protein n=1 Tax=Gemella morbillorum TaxID=29391 RepID=UPI001CB44E82|nr:hypothetical protein [Gemella morbillorum]MBF1209007.1 hypothetical protein [Gemella morbillorum]MBF1212832.1 hypothetical protein [Gemella morbillorum]